MKFSSSREALSGKVSGDASVIRPFTKVLTSAGTVCLGILLLLLYRLVVLVEVDSLHGSLV